MRFFIYNIFTINLHYKSKIIIIKKIEKYIYKTVTIIINIECIHIYSCVCCLRFLT